MERATTPTTLNLIMRVNDGEILSEQERAYLMIRLRTVLENWLRRTQHVRPQKPLKRIG